MSDELLQRATRALRDTTEPHHGGADEMLERISRRRASSAVPTRSRRAWVFALAATFVGVGAWASAAGKLPVFSRVFSKEPFAGAPAASSSPRARRAPLQARRPELTRSAAQPDPLPPAAREIQPPPPAAPVPAPRPAPRENPKPARAPHSAEATPQLDVESLYRDAHRAHFTGGDVQAAITAWDRYLSAAGSSGRMLVEARYNRAIALARAGRARESITALRPFAEGQYGGYRRDEARKLIASLESSSR